MKKQKEYTVTIEYVEPRPEHEARIQAAANIVLKWAIESVYGEARKGRSLKDQPSIIKKKAELNRLCVK